MLRRRLGSLSPGDRQPFRRADSGVRGYAKHRNREFNVAHDLHPLTLSLSPAMPCAQGQTNAGGEETVSGCSANGTCATNSDWLLLHFHQPSPVSLSPCPLAPIL